MASVTTKKVSKAPVPICRGVDVGTANLAASYFRCGDDGRLMASTTSVRDCFLTFPSEEALTLQMSGVTYHETPSGHLIVVSTEALRLAAALGLEVRRPLAQGFISDKEDLGKEVVRILLEAVLGAPEVKDEIAVFSIPGVPYQGDPSKAAFHTRFFSDRIRELGFTPLPVNEAMAIGFNALGQESKTDKKFTGLCLSFGAGLTNVALVYQGMLSKAFSLALGGDWIDNTVAAATNTPISSVTLLKEEGIDLMAGENTIMGRDPRWIVNRKDGYHDATSDRQAEALAMTYRELLEKLCETINAFFNDPKNRVDIREPLPVVIAALNTIAKGVRLTGATTGQTSVYGTHWKDSFTSATVGKIEILCNEPTTASAAQCAITSGSPKFNSAGQVALTVVGQQVTWEMPYFAKGHTALANLAPTLTGTNTGNLTYEFQYDKGAGYNGTWLTLNATNLNGAGAITPATGVKLKVRATCATANAGNLLTQIAIPTVTNSTAQNEQYPLDTITLTLTGLVAGSDVTILAAGTETVRATQEENAGTTYAYTYEAPESVDIAVYNPGYMPFFIRGYSLGSSNASLPCAQVADVSYLA